MADPADEPDGENDAGWDDPDKEIYLNHEEFVAALFGGNSQTTISLHQMKCGPVQFYLFLSLYRSQKVYNAELTGRAEVLQVCIFTDCG